VFGRESKPREGLTAQPTSAGLTMNTHRRTNWKSAARVASTDMTFKAREFPPSSSGTIGRHQKNQATNAAMPTATIAATSLHPVKPIAAANAKIPKAQASDSAIRARSNREVTAPGGSVVWVGMCTPSKASTCELVFAWELCLRNSATLRCSRVPVYLRFASVVRWDEKVDHPRSRMALSYR
jgi:hypothetical protein